MFKIIKTTASFVKKAIIVLSVYFLVIAVFFHFLAKDKAAVTGKKYDPVKQNRKEIYKVINDKKLNSTKEGKLTITIYRFTMCKMIGEACSDNPKEGDKNFERSAFGFISKLIMLPYSNPPASGVYWAYTGLQSAGFIPKSYAAEGIGLAAIKPYTNLWKIFRDLSYMLLVLVLIAIGFMIMFRMKMNPQTVISVENALPKIVVSLILITFSFAIAGFMIDLTYILIALIISILSSHDLYFNAGQYTNDFLTASPWKIYETLYSGLKITKIGNALLSLTGNAIHFSIRTGLGIGSAILFGKIFSPFMQSLFDITDGIKNQAIAAVNLSILGAILNPVIRGLFILAGLFLGFFLFPQILIGFLVWFTVVFLFIKIFMTLFNSYLKIFLYIIFAPVLLLFESIPGKNIFTWWLKSLISELLYFPVLVTLLLIGNIIQNIAASGVQMWQPPFLMGIDPNTYSILVGMMILLLIPDFMKLIRELLGLKELPINFGLGTFFGGAGTAVSGITGPLGQFGSIALALQYIPGGVGKRIMETFGMISKEPITPKPRPPLGGVTDDNA